MSDIFISYEKSDLPRAEMLARSLVKRGWTTFWDRTIPAGSTWRKTIGRELDGARCVVVLWSRASMDSRWVHEEADDALGRNILVPVLIENIQPPLGFRSIQAGNLTNWDGAESAAAFEKLIADITGLIGPPIRVPKVEVSAPRVPAAPLPESSTQKLEPQPSTLKLKLTDSEFFGWLIGAAVVYGSRPLHHLLQEQPGTGIVVFLFCGMIGAFGIYWSASMKIRSLLVASWFFTGTGFLMLVLYVLAFYGLATFSKHW